MEQAPSIAQTRLAAQHITTPMHSDIAEVVGELGAIQAQDYLAATWAIGLRSGHSKQEIDHAFNEGQILRTHILRPTWHFVTPEDIRWMLALSAPHIEAQCAYYYRQEGLDAGVLEQANKIITQALVHGNQLTRAELNTLLDQHGIHASNLGYSFIVIHAELSGIICSGRLREKQHTYALLDERAPTYSVSADEALAMLTERYFTSHGPAALKDYAWWSGLSQANAKRGLEMVKSKLQAEEFGGTSYWAAAPKQTAEATEAIYLLPNYDEYVVAYADRSVVFNATHTKHLDARKNPLFQNTVVADGQIIGTWQRTLKSSHVDISVHLFDQLSRPGQQLEKAAEHYGSFLGLPHTLSCD
jgi:hypothetical protein